MCKLVSRNNKSLCHAEDECKITVQPEDLSASVRGGSSGAVAPLDFENVEIAPLNF